MRSWPVFILSLMLVVPLACHEHSNAPTASNGAGIYQYTGYDSSATIVATGTMRFTRLDSVITGERDLNGSGPEAGSGSLSGSVNLYGTITIRFPSEQIGGLYLRGSRANSSIAGDRFLNIGARTPGIKVGTFRLIPSSH
jgi:hypothetical protein